MYAEMRMPADETEVWNAVAIVGRSGAMTRESRLIMKIPAPSHSRSHRCRRSTPASLLLVSNVCVAVMLARYQSRGRQGSRNGDWRSEAEGDAFRTGVGAAVADAVLPSDHL